MALKYCMSQETVMILNNLGLTLLQLMSPDDIVTSLQRYIQGRVNETVERRNLRLRKQIAGETFDNFLVSLRELSADCNYCDNDCLQKNIRDQIIDGLRHAEAVPELLQVQILTLDVFGGL